MFDIHLSLLPPRSTSQQKGTAAIFSRAGRYRGLRHYKKAQVRRNEHDLAVLLLPYRPASPLLGPVCLDVTATWPWRRNEPEKRLALGYAPMDTRPDASRWVETLQDQLTKLGFWHDDAQVADLRVRKLWGREVGIRIVIYRL
ncbi:MAG: RusA family crossover junction endodeoxyribonuclease [Candidatus Edwardsbacteria bacterium]|nr:RusA family crossover junction endodeoxyribonuclease [Candidatus Edwardsbacteria bacterium]